MEDKALIQRTLAGHPDEFETLVRRYQKVIFVFVHRQLRDMEASREVVQATLVHAYVKLAQFRGEASFKTWLHGIALNQCRTWQRTSGRRQAVAIDEVPEAALPQTAAGSPASEDRLLLRRLVARLPERQRAVLSLRVFGDLPFGEIARLQNISENSAKVNYHHAIARLKKWMAAEQC